MTVVVSYSEVDTYRQCAFKHHLAYVDRYSAPPRAGSALARGTRWHTVLEFHYNALKCSATLQEAQDAVFEYLFPYQQEESALSQEEIDEDLHWWMYQGYVAQYGKDSNWTLEGVEESLVVPVLDDKGNESEFSLKVKTDLVVINRMSGLREIIDHKSCAVLPADREYDFDDQFAFYQLALTRAGRAVHRTVHSAARTKRNVKKPQALEDRFRRTPMHRTREELAMVERELLATLRAMYGADNRAPRSPDPDRCGWRCSFTEACLFGRRKGSNLYTIRMLEDTGFTQNFERH